MTAPVIVVAEPTAPGRFRVMVGGVEICANTTQPFFDGCRSLIERGADTATVAVLRHAGSSTDCLRARIGAAAALTVEDSDGGTIRVRRWKPFPYRAVASGIAKTNLAAIAGHASAERAMAHG